MTINKFVCSEKNNDEITINSRFLIEDLFHQTY